MVIQKCYAYHLTHWGLVTHICVSKLSIIGSDNSLSPGRRQAIIWTNDGILLFRTFRTHFSEIVSKMHPFSFKKMHFKMSSGKWRPCCLGLNELNGKLFYRPPLVPTARCWPWGVFSSWLASRNLGTVRSNYYTYGRYVPRSITKCPFHCSGLWHLINCISWRTGVPGRLW